jgi:tRNA 2-thiouridine synthesizing protein A
MKSIKSGISKMAKYELNVRRMLCPMPVIKTQNKVKELHNGDILTVIATDPGARHDVPSWCRMYGHEVIECKFEDDELYITIKINK